MKQTEKWEFRGVLEPKVCRPRLFLLRAIILGVISLGFSLTARADTISGTVKDPSGAVVVGAQIEISGGDLAKPILLTAGGGGRFNSPDLKPGKYTVRVTSIGFEPESKEVELHGTVELQFSLT